MLPLGVGLVIAIIRRVVLIKLIIVVIVITINVNRSGNNKQWFITSYCYSRARVYE